MPDRVKHKGLVFDSVDIHKRSGPHLTFGLLLEFEVLNGVQWEYAPVVESASTSASTSTPTILGHEQTAGFVSRIGS